MYVVNSSNQILFLEANIQNCSYKLEFTVMVILYTNIHIRYIITHKINLNFNQINRIMNYVCENQQYISFYTSKNFKIHI